MDLSLAINLLTITVLILIAIIASKKAKLVVRNIIEKVIPSLLLFLGIIIACIFSIFFILWGWKKLHEIFPEMWPIKEILGVALFLAIIYGAKHWLTILDKKYLLTERITKFEQKKNIGIVLRNTSQGFCGLIPSVKKGSDLEM